MCPHQRKCHHQHVTCGRHETAFSNRMLVASAHKLLLVNNTRFNEVSRIDEHKEKRGAEGSGSMIQENIDIYLSYVHHSFVQA